MRAALPLLLAALALALPALAEEPSAPVIRIAGTGTVAAAPDLAELTAGVETEDDTAEAAMARNAETMRGVLAALEAAGVPKADIRTSGLSLSAMPRRLPDGRVEAGETFRALNHVTVRTGDLAGVGALLDALVRSGANRIGGVRFTLEDDAAALAEARRAAIADARTAAETFATAAGLVLGPVREIAAGGGEPGHGGARATAQIASAVPVEPGQLTISAGVTVTWTLAPAE